MNDTEQTITDEQRGDMLHALGLPEYPVNAPLPKTRRHHRIFRNYYTCDMESPSGRSWLALERMGLAVHRAKFLSGDNTCFFVTKAGVEFIGATHLIDPNHDTQFPSAVASALIDAPRIAAVLDEPAKEKTDDRT